MILEDEELVRIPLVLNENLSVTIVLTLEVSTNDNHIPCFAQVLNRNSAILARSTHKQLKNDLVEHIWHRYEQRKLEIHVLIKLLLLLYHIMYSYEPFQMNIY